jgi:hypothetical protein
MGTPARKETTSINNRQRSRKNLRGTWGTPKYECLLPGMGVTLAATTLRPIFVGFNMDCKQNKQEKQERTETIDLTKEEVKKQENRRKKQSRQKNARAVGVGCRKDSREKHTRSRHRQPCHRMGRILGVLTVFSHFVRFRVPTCFSAVSGAKKLGSASSCVVLYSTFSAMVLMGYHLYLYLNRYWLREKLL